MSDTRSGHRDSGVTATRQHDGSKALVVNLRDRMAAVDEDDYNIWPSFGYRKNPYGTEELRPDDEGDALLVGREAEVRALMRQWFSSTQIATIEGPVGVGKTSLAGVAAYRAMKQRLERRGPLVVPLIRTVQFEADTESLTQRIFMEVGQTLLHHEQTLRNCGHAVPDLNAIRTWINAPVVRGGSVGAGGLSAGRTTAVNSTTGFSQSGFQEHIRHILTETFPSDQDGSLVGIIDNLELLQTASAARDCLNNIRDSVLQLPGVRWVLVGATGIVKTAISIPRLSGKVASPIKLEPIDSATIEELVQRRLDYYTIRADATPPVSPEEFKRLYNISGKNLRDTLKHAQDYSMWLADRRDAGLADPSDPLAAWISKQVDFEATRTALTAAADELFQTLVENGGAVPASVLADDPSTYAQKVRYRVRILEQVNLAETIGSDEDLRVKTVRLTALGWFFQYQRSQPPQQQALDLGGGGGE